MCGFSFCMTLMILLYYALYSAKYCTIFSTQKLKLLGTNCISNNIAISQNGLATSEISWR